MSVGIVRPSRGNVDQERRRDLVPVPRPVVVVLVVPLQLAGVGVERDHRVGVEVVAGPLVADPRPRVAGAPVGQVELRIVRSGDPDRGAAGAPGLARPGLAPRLARLRNRVGAPHLLAGVGIERGHEPADAPLAARGSDQHLAVRHERRNGHVVPGPVVGDRRLPDHLPGHRVEGHHERVVRRVKNLVAVQGDAAVRAVRMGHVLRELPVVDPELLSRARIDGDDPVLGRGNEHDAVVDDRRRLVAGRHPGRHRPHGHEIAHVLPVDLIQRAVALAVVGPAVHQPVARIGLPQPFVGHRGVRNFRLLRRRHFRCQRHGQRTGRGQRDPSRHSSHLVLHLLRCLAHRSNTPTSVPNRPGWSSAPTSGCCPPRRSQGA